ncbi:MAG: hypothetical protein RIC19_03835 [Phaeodactylibacter sp.]|uniref:hypothetical protein n=1 Tax=Phaeodactylibacter sp. TaxID=1940289 RepID=UPI0032ECBD5E
MPRQWLGLASSPGALSVRRSLETPVYIRMDWPVWEVGTFARRADYGKTKSAPGECPGNGLD